MIKLNSKKFNKKSLLLLLFTSCATTKVSDKTLDLTHILFSGPVQTEMSESPPSIRELASSQDTHCYNPYTEPKMLKMYGKKFMQKAKPLFKYLYNEFDMDPRLIFHRMTGEGGGNPEIRNPSSGAYGIFQYLGRFLGKASHESQLRDLYQKMKREKHAELTKTDKQLIQLYYYTNHYVKESVDLIEYNGCGKKARQKFGRLRGKKLWKKLTAIEKVAVLGWGDCSKMSLQKEGILLSGRNYGYTPRILGSVKGVKARGVKKKKLCKDWLKNWKAWPINKEI